MSPDNYEHLICAMRANLHAREDEEADWVFLSFDSLDNIY